MSKVKKEDQKLSREEFMVEAANVTKYLDRIQVLTNKAKQIKSLAGGKMGHATRTNLNTISKRIDIWIARIHESEEKVGMKYQDIMKLYREILEDAAKKAAERIKAEAEKAKSSESAEKSTKKTTKKSIKKSDKTKTTKTKK